MYVVMSMTYICGDGHIESAKAVVSSAGCGFC